MKRLLVGLCLCFFLCVSWEVGAFDETHLKKFKALNQCSECDLSLADLHGLDMTEADLQGVNLFGTDLHGADLSGAVRRQNLVDLKLPELRET